jgi:CRP/FNR family transcriptional regulator, anaerobic regulatory protein
VTDLENYIGNYFGVVNPLEAKKIESFFYPKILKKGSYFLKTGRNSSQLAFIKSGMLRIFVETETKEVTQWISTQGYFVTDLSSFLFGQTSRWNIQALEETEVYVINKEDYNTLSEVIPNWLTLEKMFLAKCFTILEDRIFSHLSLSAEERYQLFFSTHKELFNQVPLQYIASMLGMTPETFSRIRKNLK